jgi:hypothetical protein
MKLINPKSLTLVFGKTPFNNPDGIQFALSDLNEVCEILSSNIHLHKRTSVSVKMYDPIADHVLGVHKCWVLDEPEGTATSLVLDLEKSDGTISKVYLQKANFYLN